MLYDNDLPRYLPHLDHPEVLSMGLSPLRDGPWIETDTHLARYHRHKLDYRARCGERSYLARASSLPAQRELSASLLQYLCSEQAAHYQLEGDRLVCKAGDFAERVDSPEPLWNCSLWVADDLVVMEEIDGEYCLTAASLCCPSHWRLEEKFDRPLREIHDPIPGFHQALTPKIDRFLGHLKPRHPVIRFNWSLQTCDSLDQRPECEPPAAENSSIYYRTERQSLVRLPRTGAIAFTIRVYLHPLETIRAFPGALEALFAAIEATPPALAEYKRFTQLAPALARYQS